MKWKFMRHGDAVWIDDENGICIAECPLNEDGEPPLAHGRLIAAVPDLLVALEDALEYIAEDEDVSDGNDGFPVPNRAMQLAQSLRAVLKSAKGE